jgi:phage gpG-like protein
MAGAGISITIDAEYAQFHQTGTARMPARPILPDGDTMPDEWERAIDDAMENAFDRDWEDKR